VSTERSEPEGPRIAFSREAFEAVLGELDANLRLIEKPKICIEYVALHELAHLLHPHHGRVFYNFLSMHMPDWKKRKILLETS
jgi:predicted metal-dependent hydrolase